MRSSAAATTEQLAWGVGHLGAQPVAPFAQPVSLDAAGAEAVRSADPGYIICPHDRAIPPPMQRRMLQAAGCDPVIEIDTDHSPWLSRTDELVAALDRLAAGR